MPNAPLSKPKGPLAQLGVVGLRYAAGRVYEEFLPELASYNAIRVYNEMRRNDATIGAILFAIKMLLRRVKWHAEPADGKDTGDGTDDPATKFLQECWDDMNRSWYDTLGDILTFLPFGWAWLEILYKKRLGPEQKDGTLRSAYTDGKIGWRKWELRGQDSLFRWEFDDDNDGGLLGFTQQGPPDYEPHTIPIERSLLFRSNTEKNNPEGTSVLRNAYRAWYFCRRLEEIEAIGMERDLAGYPVLHAPENVQIFDETDPDMVTLLQRANDIVTSIRRDQSEGCVLPFGWELELLASGGSRQIDIQGAIQRWDQRKAVTVLGDFILLGSQANTGSGKALSVDKTELFQDAIEAWLDMIADTINRYAIPRLFALNPGLLPKNTLPPVMKHADVRESDLGTLADFVQKLAAAGIIVPDTQLEDYVRAQGNLPPREEGDELQDRLEEGAMRQGKPIPQTADQQQQQQQDQMESEQQNAADEADEAHQRQLQMATHQSNLRQQELAQQARLAAQDDDGKNED